MDDRGQPTRYGGLESRFGAPRPARLKRRVHAYWAHEEWHAATHLRRAVFNIKTKHTAALHPRVPFFVLTIRVKAASRGFYALA